MKVKEELSDEEIYLIAIIMNHLSDYISKDDRPDHGIAKLEPLRDAPQELKNKIYYVTGKLLRYSRKRALQ